MGGVRSRLRFLGLSSFCLVPFPESLLCVALFRAFKNHADRSRGCFVLSSCLFNRIVITFVFIFIIFLQLPGGFVCLLDWLVADWAVGWLVVHFKTGARHFEVSTFLRTKGTVSKPK